MVSQVKKETKVHWVSLVRGVQRDQKVKLVLQDLLEELDRKDKEGFQVLREWWGCLGEMEFLDLLGLLVKKVEKAMMEDLEWDHLVNLVLMGNQERKVYLVCLERMVHKDCLAKVDYQDCVDPKGCLVYQG